jgi:glycosyltransferase involved in cell wall biosynthesis
LDVLFIHKVFPAQLGPVARALARRPGFRCTYVCERLPTTVPGRGAVRYTPDFASGVQLGTVVPSAGSSSFQVGAFGAAPPPALAPPAEQTVEGIRLIQFEASAHDFASLEGQLGLAEVIYQTLKAHPEVRPDLVVGPAIYASSTFLPDLYDCPVINYFDYYYHPSASFLDFRPEFPAAEADRIKARAHNGQVLLDLYSCAAGYSPTQWQHDLFPQEYQSKIATIFDGIDRQFWYRRPAARRIGDRPPIPPETRIVTLVARGLEALRGFDIFMKVAQRIARVRSDVVFVVVGSEHFYHGPDLKYIREKSFVEHVLAQDRYDLSRFIFAGRVPSAQLAEILSLSDLHIYLTAPFVLSWSLFDALACGCTVLASDTAPVREVIRAEQTGLLAGFFDVDGLTQQALQVLAEPAKYRPLGEAGVRLIDAKYSLERTIPEMIALYERVLGQGGGSRASQVRAPGD